MLIFKNLYFNR